MYADGMNQRKTNTIRRKFVEAALVQNGNTPLTIDEIANSLDENLGIEFSEADLREVIIKDAVFAEKKAVREEETKYALEEGRYRLLVGKSEQNIESVIDRYVTIFHDKLRMSGNQLKQLLEDYLYALLNSNIATYSQVLSPASAKNNGRVQPDNFDEEQIRYINDFISWHDDEKNKELYKLVSYCIEYAIVVNDSNENTLIDSLSSKKFYLDNSLIYRAIGINGESRRKRTLSFIKKCCESGQQLFISKYSREEFLDTIDHHISQLAKTTPYGKIDPRIFQRYANGEGFYQFYHEWRQHKLAYGFELFKSHIMSEYNALLNTYGIKEDFSVPFKEQDFEEIEKYKDQIRQLKIRGHERLYHNDACNMYWIECKRAGNEAKITDTKYYFLTSDQKLQKWDYSHSHNQPITLLPSQWMALLLKYVSRTNDDYKSFVSFLKLPHNEPAISPDELQVVMAGISEITESFKTQTAIVDNLFESDWRAILKETPRVSAKEFAKGKLEDEMLAQLAEKDRLHQTSIDEINKSVEEKLSEYRKEAEIKLAQQEKETKENRLKEIERLIRDMTIMKDRADRAVNSQMSFLKLKIAFMAIVTICIYIGIVFWIGWEKMEQFTWLVVVLIGLAGFLYFVFYEKAFSLERTLSKYRLHYMEHYYSLFMYSEEKYKDLAEAKEELQAQVNK